MHLSTRVLGAHVARALAARNGAPVLSIGSDHFRRRDLGSVECYHFIAAAHLTAAIKAIGDVKNTRDLFDRVPPEALVLPGIGAVSLAVLGAAFEAKRIGGEAPLESWMHRHRGEGRREYVTFDTLKTQEKNREPGEARAARARADRKHARRNKAHELRVDRLMVRQGKARNATQ